MQYGSGQHGEVDLRPMFLTHEHPIGVSKKSYSHKEPREGTLKSSQRPLALWSATVLIIISATVLLANDHRNWLRLTELMFGSTTAHPEDRGRSEHLQLRQQSRNGASILLAPPTNAPRLTRIRSASERCRELAAFGQEPPVYLETSIFSQCTLLYVEYKNQKPTSVFLQIQTDMSGMISSFRIKFSTDNTEARGLIQFGLRSLQSYGGFYHDVGDWIPILSEKIQRWQDFQLVVGPYSIQMDREIGDPARFNLMGRAVKTDTMTLPRLTNPL